MWGIAMVRMERIAEAAVSPRTPKGGAHENEPDTETETENTIDSTYNPAREQVNSVS